MTFKVMKILTSSYTLDLAGVPTFTLTMYRELVKCGHEVTVYSPFGGRLEKEMNVVKNLDNLDAPDVIIAQHTPCAISLREIFPKTPFLFYSHGLLPEIEQPPDVKVDHYLVINEEVENNLIAQGVPRQKISIVRDFIDTERFSPTKPINKKLKKVLFISNYKKWKNYYRVNKACTKLGLELKCLGAPYGRKVEVEKSINEADLVISWGRGILEAMACGRAALSFDRFEGEGYITKVSYFEARRDNFSGRIFKYEFTPDSLAEEMLKYDSNCSKVNRNLIMKYHNAKVGVGKIIAVIKKIMLTQK